MNPTVALTLILLFLMVAAGVVSAAWGYALGREALKGITQPDVRPSTAVTDAGGAPRREEVTILKEADILADVKARMNGIARDTTLPNTPISSPESASPSPTPSASPAANSVEQVPVSLLSQDQGVSLSVTSVRQESGSLVLDMGLQNEGSQSVKFLYSFMKITDNQGRSFSGNTDGLPAELSPDGELYTGTVSIPLVLLDGATELSLSLTDYPEQQLKLQLSGIPVVR